MTGELHQRDLRIATLSGERAELRVSLTSDCCAAMTSQFVPEQEVASCMKHFS